MEVILHPLQKESVDLLRSLYHDARLSPTSAMVSIINGYYPSVKEIIKTLKFYKDQPEVVDFLKSNEALVYEATESIATKVKAEEAITDSATNEEQHPDITGNSFLDFRFSNAYSTLKKFPTETIEKALSEALSELCEEKLSVEVLMTKVSKKSNLSAELSLYVKSDWWEKRK
ncbi:hypothetical protein P3D00_05305 [Pseudomonas aeruginosa]|nr:hypothetical protein [Pseudomonas aeruginosa]